MHEIGAQNRDILLKPRQNRLADAQRLNRFLIRAGKQMFIVRLRQAKQIPHHMWKGEVHRMPRLEQAGPTRAGT
ncbi:MAG TPA: hypothetical protein VE690_20470 [Rhodopila sp.]|jgi:hypothetical protein|nr:hypothetical protein [Rhodopila sp.]